MTSCISGLLLHHFLRGFLLHFLLVLAYEIFLLIKITLTISSMYVVCSVYSHPHFLKTSLPLTPVISLHFPKSLFPTRILFSSIFVTNDFNRNHLLGQAFGSVDSWWAHSLVPKCRQWLFVCEIQRLSIVHRGGLESRSPPKKAMIIQTCTWPAQAPTAAVRSCLQWLTQDEYFTALLPTFRL